MARTLPKGHLSCLSGAFRYTPAERTNVAETFARIARELGTRKMLVPVSQRAIEHLPPPEHRPFPRETLESAWRLLRAGGLRPESDHRASPTPSGA
jgi:hypothetical protein